MTNADRARRAEAAIRAYQGRDGEFYLHDLICDLGHWLDRHESEDAGGNMSLDDACERAISHYQDEVAEEERPDAEEAKAEQL